MIRGVAGVVVAGLALAIAACSEKPSVATSSDPTAPSAAEVERNAMADFVAPQTGVAPPNPNASFDGPFTAGGMEPFWSARIADGKITFARPESDAVTVDIGRLKPQGGVARVTKNKLSLIIAAQPCADSVGSQLDYRVLVTYDGDAYEGCARVGDAPPSKDWSAFIDDFLPAIDACLARAQTKGADGARVTVAYPRTAGHAGVRISDGVGGRWECDAETRAGGGVKFFDAVDENDVLPGEWSPMFTRAPGAAPVGECYRNEPAKAADGTVLGWLTYESC